MCQLKTNLPNYKLQIIKLQGILKDKIYVGVATPFQEAVEADCSGPV